MVTKADAPKCQERPIDVCTNSKPSVLTMQYIGGTALTNRQEGKASVLGTAFGDPAFWQARSKHTVVGSGSVALNGVFTFGWAGTKLDAETTINIGGQSVELHTSCSKTLRTGDVFGAVKLVGFQDVNGRTHNDASNGGCGSTVEETSFCTICDKQQKTRPLLLVFEYTGPDGANMNLQGSRAGGTLTGIFPSSTQLTMADKKAGTFFSQTVSTNQRFTVSAPGGTKFEAETRVTLGSFQSFFFHTSCSVPLRTGDRYGPLRLIGGGQCQYVDASLSLTSPSVPSTTIFSQLTSSMPTVSHSDTIIQGCTLFPASAIYGSSDGPAGSGVEGGWDATHCVKTCVEHPNCAIAVYSPHATVISNAGYCELWGKTHTISEARTFPGFDSYVCEKQEQHEETSVTATPVPSLHQFKSCGAPFVGQIIVGASDAGGSGPDGGWSRWDCLNACVQNSGCSMVTYAERPTVYTPVAGYCELWSNTRTINELVSQSGFDTYVCVGTAPNVIHARVADIRYRQMCDAKCDAMADAGVKPTNRRGNRHTKQLPRK